MAPCSHVLRRHLGSGWGLRSRLCRRKVLTCLPAACGYTPANITMPVACNAGCRCRCPMNRLVTSSFSTCWTMVATAFWTNAHGSWNRADGYCCSYSIHGALIAPAGVEAACSLATSRPGTSVWARWVCRPVLTAPLMWGRCGENLTLRRTRLRGGCAAVACWKWKKEPLPLFHRP